MNGQSLCQSLRAGTPVFGTLLTSPSPHLPKAIMRLPLDFVFIDTEHIPIGRESLAWMCTTYRALGFAPIVRIPSPDPYQATMALDGGAEGIIAPYVESEHQVQQLVGAVKHRPLKGRLLDDLLTGRSTPAPTLRHYMDAECAGNVLIVNIESTPGVESLPKILQIAGLDGVLIGPHDLSTSLGIPEQYADPAFDAAVRKIISLTRAAGKGVGIHYWHDIEQEKAWLAAGANLVIHSADVLAFVAGMKRDLDILRQTAGAAKTTAPGAINI